MIWSSSSLVPYLSSHNTNRFVLSKLQTFCHSVAFTIELFVGATAPMDILNFISIFVQVPFRDFSWVVVKVQ